MTRGRKPSSSSALPSDLASSGPGGSPGPSAGTPKLSDAEIQDHLRSVPEWSEVSEAIQRTYHFKDFRQSMAFVSRVADAAEADQHHPDILVRYNKVTLTLSTHDAGGITRKDFALAKACDGFAKP